MKMILRKQGIPFRFDSKCCYSVCKKFLFSSNGSSYFGVDGKDVKFQEVGNGECLRKVDGVVKGVDDVCQILQGGGPWGHAIENALSVFDEMPQPELVVGVLRKLKDVNAAVNYFRWVERKTGKAHFPEAYDSLLLVMAKNKKFDCVEEVLGEMSVAGFGPANNTCSELVVSSVRSRDLREAFELIQTMRKFKFRPAFSLYTTLIGALSEVNESDLMLALFHQTLDA